MSDTTTETAEAEVTCKEHGNDASCQVCYEAEVRAFSASERYYAYLSGDGKSVTTFAGGVLATVTELWTRKGRTPQGQRYERHHVRATAPDGTLWWGSGRGKNMSLCLHVARSRERTAELTIASVKQLPNTAVGNPRFSVYFEEIGSRVTMSDAQFAYGLGTNEGYREGDRVRVTLTRSDRIRLMEPVKAES